MSFHTLQQPFLCPPPLDCLLLSLIDSAGCSAAFFICSFFVAKTNFVMAKNIWKK